MTTIVDLFEMSAAIGSAYFFASVALNRSGQVHLVLCLAFYFHDILVLKCDYRKWSLFASFFVCIFPISGRHYKNMNKIQTPSIPSNLIFF